MNHTPSSMLQSPLCLPTFLRIKSPPSPWGFDALSSCPMWPLSPQSLTLVACSAAQLCGSPASRHLHVASSTWHALPEGGGCRASAPSYLYVSQPLSSSEGSLTSSFKMASLGWEVWLLSRMHQTLGTIPCASYKSFWKIPHCFLKSNVVDIIIPVFSTRTP